MKKTCKLIFMTLLFWICLNCVTVRADVVTDLEIEQVLTKMPEIKAYITGEGAAELDIIQIQAYKGEEALAVDELKSFEEAGEGIRYYLLLDISGSITAEEFQALKEAVLSFVQQMKEQDELSVITFGDEVNVFWQKDEGVSALNERLQTLNNDNMNTKLYEALSQVADVCMKQTDMMRKCVIILSDGVDDIKGVATKNEAEQKIKEAGIPVYGIAIGDDNQEGVDRFGELVRSSGGELSLAQIENAGAQLASLNNRIRNAVVLKLSGSSNLVSNGVETIRLEFKNLNLTKEAEAGFYQYMPDESIPEITEVTQIGKNQIEITFSEPVNGLSELSNFELVDADGKETVPQGASPENSTAVKLTFAENFLEGDYTLECHNITDVSMEKNMLAAAAKELSLTGEKPSKVMELLKTWGWIGVLVGLLLLALIIFIIYRRIKKNKGILVVDEKLTLASNVEDQVRQVINVDEKEGMHLYISISSGRSDAVDLERDIFDSMIVGRSDMCELCVEDNRMSKQHFVLEYEDKNLYITDLESTNGTMVNGIRIGERQRLNDRDVITAGNTAFAVHWEETE